MAPLTHLLSDRLLAPRLQRGASPLDPCGAPAAASDPPLNTSGIHTGPGPVAEGVNVNVAVVVGRLVRVGVAVGVGVGVAVLVKVLVRVGISVRVGVLVAVGVCVAVRGGSVPVIVVRSDAVTGALWSESTQTVLTRTVLSGMVENVPSASTRRREAPGASVSIRQTTVRFSWL